HEAGEFDKSGCLFKLTYLRSAVRTLNYDYSVWFDADSFFVGNPGNVLVVMRHSPIHIALEGDVCRLENRRPEWWGCPNATFAELMRARGVFSNSIFNVNAGFFIIHHDVIDTVFDLAFDFWHFCRLRGFVFTEEAPLAYA